LATWQFEVFSESFIVNFTFSATVFVVFAAAVICFFSTKTYTTHKSIHADAAQSMLAGVFQPKLLHRFQSNFGQF